MKIRPMSVFLTEHGRHENENWAEFSYVACWEIGPKFLGVIARRPQILTGRTLRQKKNIFYKKDPTKYLSFDIICFLIEATQVRLLQIRPVSFFLTEHGTHKNFPN